MTAESISFLTVAEARSAEIISASAGGRFASPLNNIKKAIYAGTKTPAEFIATARIGVSLPPGSDVIQFTVHHPLLSDFPEVIGVVDPRAVEGFLERIEDGARPANLISEAELEELGALSGTLSAELIISAAPTFAAIIAATCRGVKFDDRAVQDHLDKAEGILDDLIGEDRRSVSDAGVYIPGSAKEAAALRKIEKVSNEQLEAERKKTLNGQATMILKSLSDLKKLVIQIHSSDELMESGDVVYPEIMTVATRLNDKRVRDKWSRLKDGEASPAHVEVMFRGGRLGAISGALSGIVESLKGCTEKLKDNQRSPTEAVPNLDVGVEVAVILSMSEAISGDLEDLQSYGGCERAAIKNLTNAFSGFPATNEAGILTLRQWQIDSTLSQARRRATKNGEGRDCLELYKKPPLYPEFVRRGGGDTSAINTPEKLIEAYGLNASQMGKSIPDRERAELIARSAAALNDLADYLGVDPERVGLGGGLSLALGARGKGFSKAMAHYEPNHSIINLTRKNGMDGSLAHEFGHALDYGVDGKSFFTPENRSEWLDDPDIYEAFQGVCNKLFSGKAEEFVATRTKEFEKWDTLSRECAEEYRRKANEATEEKRESVQIWRDLKEIFSKQEEKRLAELDGDLQRETPEAREESQKTRHAFSEKRREIEREYNIRLARVDHFRQLANDYRKIAYDVKRVLTSVKSGAPLTDLRGNRYMDNMPREFIEAELGEGWIPSETSWRAAFLGSLDTKNKSDYWASPKEMFARSFETFIRRKMDGDDRSNNMLVQEAYPEGLYSPYPSLEEQEGIDEAMEEFIQVLKAKRYF